MRQSQSHHIPNRWTRFAFKNGMVAQNRVVVPPMASGTADVQGAVTSQTLRHYENLTRAGAGIVMVEYTYVHSSGRSEENQLGLHSDGQVPAHQKLVSSVHQAGALVGIQLVHGGGKSSKELTGGRLLGASDVVVPTKGNDLEKPVEMNRDEIKAYQSWYLDAAIRAADAGYDLIELHAAHGYGLNQWLSSLTNQRTDEYGGNLINRSRMLFEIFQAIRKALPHLLLGVRIPGEDHFRGGLTPDDMFFVSRRLDVLGADFLDVSSGIGGWRRPADRSGEGYLLPEATSIQQRVGIPVIGVGGIETGTFIDAAIARKRVSFTAVGRKILKDPKLFFEEVLVESSVGPSIANEYCG